MKPKNVVSIVLLAFVGASVAFLIAKESRSGSAAPEESAQTADTTVTADERTGVEKATPPVEGNIQPQLIAYYFHQTQRCKTCLTIESYAKEALQGAFPDEWKSGKIAWRLVNIEKPENEHFVADYGLVSSTLVLVPTAANKTDDWRKLEKVWELVGNELKFKAYVESEAMMLLETDS